MQVPGVGHYDQVSDTYIKMTQQKVKGLKSISSDKEPRMGFLEGRESAADADAGANLDVFLERKDFFRYDQANKGGQDFSLLVDREKVLFLRKQVEAQKELNAEKVYRKKQLNVLYIKMEREQMIKDAANKRNHKQTFEGKEREERNARIVKGRKNIEFVMRSQFD